MKKLLPKLQLVLSGFIILLLVSCGAKAGKETTAKIDTINLKRGELVLCGPPDQEFGTVAFETSATGKTKTDFDLGIALLHSFEYDEAEKVFAKIIDQQPQFAMAYWGVAMSNYHPLWAPPTLPELQKGAKAIAIAQSLGEKTKKEEAFINALSTFYKGWDTVEHRKRALLHQQAMEKVYRDFPNDKEVAAFYALSLVAAADPADKTYTNQKKAGDILTNLYPGQPNHPGIVHYIIHTYDYPELAERGLDAARKYASVAPSSAHAQHMPSHIFTRLGLWDECISSNLASVASAKCYAESSGIKGHWDEELHGLDYLVYGYLQKGDNDSALQQIEYLKTIKEVSPVSFKVAYAFAAIPARYVLENKLWKDAADLKVYPETFSWQKFPWQKAIIHFTRTLGAAHTDNLAAARNELKQLNVIHDTLLNQKDTYKATQVDIQIKSAEAWILFKEGKADAALSLMEAAADMEDKTEKHPVTPGEVLPARELLADMLLEMKKPKEALAAYEADLKNHHNRFNALYSAALCAQKINDQKKASFYYQQLLNINPSSHSTRKELDEAKRYLSKHVL